MQQTHRLIGERWKCNPQRLRLLKGSCVVYSFGTGWDVTFELAILRIAPRCTVRTFDPTVTPSRFWQLVRKHMHVRDGERKADELRLRNAELLAELQAVRARADL